MTPRRSTVAILVMAGLGVALFVLASGSTDAVGFPLDDAWIHQTYARNLARYGEWAFVHGTPSAASTSPLYTVLLAAGYMLGVGFYAWTFALGVIVLGVAGILAGDMARRMYPAVPHVGILTGLSVVTTWQLVWAAASGMETMVFATLTLGMVWLTWRQFDAREASTSLPNDFASGAVLGVIGGLLTMTRPEGAGFVVLTGLIMLVAWPPGFDRDGRRAYIVWAGAVCIGWLVAILPYLVLNYTIEGTILPSTSAAKQAEYTTARDEFLLARYARLLVPLLAGGQVALIPGLFVGCHMLVQKARSDHGVPLLLLPLIWACVLVTAYALRLPVAYQHGRYVMPALPHLIVYGVGGTMVIVRRGVRPALRRVLSRSLALTAILLVPGFLVIGARQYSADVRIINTEMVATAKWVDANIPAEDLLAVHDIGALGYFAPRPIFDLAGLVNPDIVPIINDQDGVMRLMCLNNVRFLMVFPDQRPVPEADPRLGRAPIFTTGAPYAPAAGGGNMMVYALQWGEACE